MLWGAYYALVIMVFRTTPYFWSVEQRNDPVFLLNWCFTNSNVVAINSVHEIVSVNRGDDDKVIT